ncbi:MAG: 8-oxo-dGTP diphosphatase [Oscillospiraceae bacterium]|nr:8-oxo-dGTP diphosphatase [Oscillospiraceae bacterium]
MDRTERVELTILCLVHQGDLLLLQDRVKADWRGYTIPGGHVEPGESIVDAVVREMREETGLTVIRPNLCGVKQFPIPGGRYLVLLFETEAFSGTLNSSEEGRVCWIPRQELSRYDTVADLEELLDVMLSPEHTEFQYLVQEEQWKVRLR